MSHHYQQEDVKGFNEVPVEAEHRRGTDIFCTVCTGIFAAILFIVCIAAMNTENLKKMTYPLDGEGNSCGYDVPQYPLLYYTSLTDPTKRLCVAECPKEGDTSLKCNPTNSLSCDQNDNPKYEVQVYDSEMEHNRIGLFCMPTDSEMRATVEQQSQIYSKNKFMNFYDSFWKAFWITILFGILYVVLVQCFPKTVVRWIMILGTITFIITGLLIIILPDGFFPLRLVVGVMLILLGVMAGFSIWKDEHRMEILVCSRLIECTTEVVDNHKFVLAYIPIFMVLFFGLIVLICFEILAVWSMAPLEFDPNVPFYKVSGFGSGFLTFLIFVEFYWGMSFLKEGFNFCVSGFATNWYCYQENNKDKIEIFKSLTLLVRFHWGSVVGGSLILSILYYLDLFFDFFFSDSDKEGNTKKKRDIEQTEFTREQEEQTRKSCNGIISMYNLARSESMGYINLIPLPYCNASRYCELLADESGFYDRSQITNRLFRLCAHIFIMAVCSLIAMESSKNVSAKMDIAGIIVVFAISMFTITYFISFHGDISEGLLVSVFLEEKLTKSMERIDTPPACMRDLYDDDKHGKFREDNTLWNFVKP